MSLDKTDQDYAMTGRIAKRFAALKHENRSGFVAFITGGDPDPETAQQILDGLPGAGADFIELGMPFSDPMADGPAIQAASLRALQAGASLKTTLDQVRRFRIKDSETPLILMGYYNPLYRYGVENFVQDASQAGVDGLIIVDLPPEEAHELHPFAREKGIDFIRLATPTSDSARLGKILSDASGFLYYVSVLGVTGTASAPEQAIQDAVTHLKSHTDLPIAVGFGIKTVDQAAMVARIADATVVGSALVERVALGLDKAPQAGDRSALVQDLLDQAQTLSHAVRIARSSAA